MRSPLKDMKSLAFQKHFLTIITVGNVTRLFTGAIALIFWTNRFNSHTFKQQGDCAPRTAINGNRPLINIIPQATQPRITNGDRIDAIINRQSF